MLDNDMIEFLTYRNAMKSNYRKGVHALRCILNNRKQAETFAGSLGGVSVVLGVSQPDGNSEALRALLEGSAVIDQATLTWLKNWWPEQCGSWDTLAADQGRCSTIATDPFLWERVGVSPVGAGKILAGLVGQDSRNFAAMQAVASSATAMQAVAVSPVAIAAIYRSDVALSAVDSEVSAAATFYGADSVAMGKAVVILAGLDPAGYADMSAVAASATAMSAVAANYVALAALYSNAEALSTAQGTTVGAAALAGAGSVATGKAAVKLAGLDPDDFADMAAVAASSTAMAAVAASSTAMAAVAASSTAMAAVAASSTAMAAVAASATARSALNGASVARQALKASPLATELSLVSSQGQYWDNPGTKAMKGLILATKAGNSDNAFSITKIDSTSTGAGQNTRNAATSGSTGYLDWYENYPNYAWVMNSITYYAYYTTTKIKYIPC